MVGRTWAAAQKTLSSASGTQRIRSANARSASSDHSSTSSLSQFRSSSARTQCSRITCSIVCMTATLLTELVGTCTGWQNGSSCRLAPTTFNTRRPRWVRVDASAGPAGRTQRTTASVPTPDDRSRLNAETPALERGFRLVRDQSVLVEPDHGAGVGGAHPQPQALGCLLLRAAASDQQTHRVLHLEVVQARLAGHQVLADLVGLSGRQLVVVERVQAAEHVGAVLELRRHRRPRQVRARGRSPRGTTRSWLRPRFSRDITVPIGVPMISAISLYEKPSTSAR